MIDKKNKRSPKQAPDSSDRSILRPFLLGLLLLAVAGGTWAVFEFVVWNTVPKELVGKWYVRRGPEEGALFDFYPNGRMRVTVDDKVAGQEKYLDARIVVKGKELHITTTNLSTGAVGTRVQTIKRLEPTRLILLGEGGQTIDLERAE